MAVAHDGEANVTVATSGGGTAASITAPNKTTAGSDRFGVVAAFARHSDAVLTATWNAVSMDMLAHHANPVDGRQVYIFGIEAPPTSASDIVVTSGVANSQLVVTVSSYNGVDQTTPADAEVTADGTASPATLNVSSVSGDMVVDSLHAQTDGTAPSVGASQIQNGNTHDGGDEIFGASSREGGAATVTMSWTLTNPVRWTLTAVNLNQSVSASVVLVPVIRQNYRNMGYS